MRLRDDNPDDVALPPYMTMQRCYAMWCWERGWKVEKESRGQGINKPVYEFTLCPHDDDVEVALWPTGSEAKKIVQWSTFHGYWKTNYPNIKIRKIS